jgi:hypothetical protein
MPAGCDGGSGCRPARTGRDSLIREARRSMLMPDSHGKRHRASH